MKKSHKITIISSIAVILLVAAAYISYPYLLKSSPIQAADDAVSSVVSSEAAPPSSDTSSETTSNEVSSAIIVPEIVPPVSSEAPAASSAPAEIKVEGSPTSKPTSKPNNTSSKPPAVQASSTPAAAPTGNGDVYDPLTGTYPKLGDTINDPIDGAPLTWTGTAWMAEDDGGKSGVGHNPNDYGEDRDIGAD